MKLQILGCYAATPRTITNPTSQVLEMKNHLFLIDCGEGTQVQLRKHKIKFSRINHIFISHLHGDHFYGLIGLISTFMLLNRENDLHVYGPKGIKEIILLQLRASGSFTGYNLYFHELEAKESEVVFEDETVIVKTIPLNHRVYTNGFLFQEKVGKRHLNIEAVAHYKIEKVYFDKIKATNIEAKKPPTLPSQDFLGETLSNNFVFPNLVPAKYAPVSLAHNNNKQPNGRCQLNL
jgi:ribonuclease Z